MLPAPLRFDLRQDSGFFSRARAKRSKLWTVLYAPTSQSMDNPSSPSPLPFVFAIIIKKTVARGVKRSKLKRMIRGAIIKALPTSLPDFDATQQVVILPTRNAVSANQKELAADLHQILLTLN